MDREHFDVYMALTTQERNVDWRTTQRIMVERVGRVVLYMYRTGLERAWRVFYDECMGFIEPLSVVDGEKEREQCGLRCSGKATYSIQHVCMHTHARTYPSTHMPARA